MASPRFRRGKLKKADQAPVLNLTEWYSIGASEALSIADRLTGGLALTPGSTVNRNLAAIAALAAKVGLVAVERQRPFAVVVATQQPMVDDEGAGIRPSPLQRNDAEHGRLAPAIEPIQSDRTVELQRRLIAVDLQLIMRACIGEAQR